MLHSLKAIGTLNTAVNNFYTAYKSELLPLSTAQWKSEDYRGKSFHQWTLMQYYNFMYLLTLIHREIERAGDHLDRDWSYYVSKYNLVKVQECLACYGINYTKGIQAFGFDTQFPEGIEGMAIESTFVITGEEKAKSDVVIKNLIAYPSTCINYIKLYGVDPVDLEHQPTTYYDTIQDTIDNNDDLILQDSE